MLLRSLSNSDKQHILSEISGLAIDAAAVALRIDTDPLNAIRFLEQGRGLLGTSLQELRTDVLDLQQKYPRLAADFSRLRNELERPVASLERLDNNLESCQKVASQRRHEIGKELEQLITEICRQLEFKDFLLAPSKAEIRDAAKYGPIVIINASVFRCDVIMIEPDRIQQIQILDINNDVITGMAREGSLGRPVVLSWLWDKIAEPILNTLGFTDPPVNKCLVDSH